VTINKRQKEILREIILHCILIIFSSIFLFPFVWLLSTSLKTEEQLFGFPPKIIPNPVRWRNYTDMLQFLPFFKFLLNTVYVTAMTIIGVLFSSTLTAFGFARLKFPGRDLLFLILLGTMMLPYQVTMVPLYLTYSRLNWVDSYKPLWVSSFFGWSFYIFLLRQFFMTIPKELEDAAKIDGCSYIMIYYKIMLPLIKPALATVAIFSFMGAWNDFIGPVIYLNSTEKLTLSVGLRLFQQQYGGYFQMMMAAATFMTIPVILIFFFAQKYFIQGIVLTGLKG
jgi:ABC-type glycerol-3-phosphate transport system permease component